MDRVKTEKVSDQKVSPTQSNVRYIKPKGTEILEISRDLSHRRRFCYHGQTPSKMTNLLQSKANHHGAEHVWR